MVLCEVFLVGLQDGDGLLVELPVLHPRQIVVGPAQLAVQLRGARLLGQGLDGVHDHLVLVVLIPGLALFHEVHVLFPLLFVPIC